MNFFYYKILIKGCLNYLAFFISNTYTNMHILIYINLQERHLTILFSRYCPIDCISSDLASSSCFTILSQCFVILLNWRPLPSKLS